MAVQKRVLDGIVDREVEKGELPYNHRLFLYMLQ